MKQPFSIAYFLQCVKEMLLGVILTRKQKRILFLTRVYINARKRQVENVMDLLKDETLYRCVDNVSDKSVFDLPFRLYEAMWSEDPQTNPQCVANERAFEEECRLIFSRVPGWMLYGHSVDRMADIRKVYSQVNRIAAV